MERRKDQSLLLVDELNEEFVKLVPCRIEENKNYSTSADGSTQNKYVVKEIPRLVKPPPGYSKPIILYPNPSNLKRLQEKFRLAEAKAKGYPTQGMQSQPGTSKQAPQSNNQNWQEKLNPAASMTGRISQPGSSKQAMESNDRENSTSLKPKSVRYLSRPGILRKQQPQQNKSNEAMKNKQQAASDSASSNPDSQHPLKGSNVTFSDVKEPGPCSSKQAVQKPKEMTYQGQQNQELKGINVLFSDVIEPRPCSSKQAVQYAKEMANQRQQNEELKLAIDNPLKKRKSYSCKEYDAPQELNSSTTHQSRSISTKLPPEPQQSSSNTQPVKIGVNQHELQKLQKTLNTVNKLKPGNNKIGILMHAPSDGENSQPIASNQGIVFLPSFDEKIQLSKSVVFKLEVVPEFETPKSGEFPSRSMSSGNRTKFEREESQSGNAREQTVLLEPKFNAQEKSESSDHEFAQLLMIPENKTPKSDGSSENQKESHPFTSIKSVFVLRAVNIPQNPEGPELSLASEKKIPKSDGCQCQCHSMSSGNQKESQPYASEPTVLFQPAFATPQKPEGSKHSLVAEKKTQKSGDFQRFSMLSGNQKEFEPCASKKSVLLQPEFNYPLKSQFCEPEGFKTPSVPEKKSPKSGEFQRPSTSRESVLFQPIYNAQEKSPLEESEEFELPLVPEKRTPLKAQASQMSNRKNSQPHSKFGTCMTGAERGNSQIESSSSMKHILGKRAKGEFSNLCPLKASESNDEPMEVGRNDKEITKINEDPKEIEIYQQIKDAKEDSEDKIERAPRNAPEQIACVEVKNDEKTSAGESKESEEFFGFLKLERSQSGVYNIEQGKIEQNFEIKSIKSQRKNEETVDKTSVIDERTDHVYCVDPEAQPLSAGKVNSPHSDMELFEDSHQPQSEPPKVEKRLKRSIRSRSASSRKRRDRTCKQASPSLQENYHIKTRSRTTTVREDKEVDEQVELQNQGPFYIRPCTADGEPLYCFCESVSEGYMVQCDNDICPWEWFHFPCVGLVEGPKGKWYCPKCRWKRSNIAKPISERIQILVEYNKEKEDQEK